MMSKKSGNGLVEILKKTIMQISRNNYEEYFLLYIDGELSKADRHAVEQFVQLHPDLADELDLLKESMLPIDELVQMPGKDQLMKQVEWQEEDVTAVRENLLLYIDNELPGTKRAELEHQLAKDITLSSELKSLAKAKLVAEHIEMPAKEDLYRREADRKPIPIRWTRWVAAAATIIGLGWFSLTMINKQTGIAPEVAGLQPTKSGTEINDPSKNATANKDEQVPQPTEQPATTVEYVSADEPSKKNTNVSSAVVTTQTSAPQKAISKPDERDLLENMSNQIAVVLPPTGVEDGKHDLNNIGTPPVEVRTLANNPAVQNKPTDNAQTPAYQYASYDETMEEENPYINIAGANISKQKLRSVFRNVTRTVTRSFDKSTVTEANVSSL
jgi:hypothetical protein